MRNFDDRLEKWRKLLEIAKPEDWKWQPPSEIEPIAPKEPPENIKVQFDEFISKLPEMERAILHLRFIDGLTEEEIAQMIGSKKAFVTVIERGAIDRLAEMFGFEEQEVCSWLAWWGEEKSKAIEAEMKNLPLRSPSPNCPSLDRLYVAHLRWDWTEGERQHVRSCDYCRYMVRKIKERIWHPSSAQLWRYVTQGEMSEEDRLDIRYHLETDNCRRCKFLAEKVLIPLIPLASLIGLPQPYELPKPAVKIEREEMAVESYEVLYYKISKPKVSAQLAVAASLVPVALSVEGFAGEVEEEVKVEEGLFRAQLRREQRGWVARAEAKNVPIGSKVLFIWLTPDGVEKFQSQVEFRPAFRDWSYAEAVIATGQEQLGEGYFIAVLLPPTF